MKKLCTALSMFVLVLTFACDAEKKNDQIYLFSYFKDNGQDGLHLAYSFDALNWTALNNDSSFLRPTMSILTAIVKIVLERFGRMTWRRGQTSPSRCIFLRTPVMEPFFGFPGMFYKSSWIKIRSNFQEMSLNRRLFCTDLYRADTFDDKKTLIS
jgi:hypothetical protein